MSVEALLQEVRKARLNYCGEEVLPLCKLTVDQIRPGLPPPGAGGRINVLDIVDGYTRHLLLHPEECILKECEWPAGACSAPAHIVHGEELLVAHELVSRGVCEWIALDEVFHTSDGPVLSGLFRVPKPKHLSDGRVVLRTILNFIPTNRLQRCILGDIAALPNISTWQSVIVGENETLHCYQSDMASAFYLFRLPDVWRKFFALNVVFDGGGIGRDPAHKFALSCVTLPMGWKSAVGITQAISRKVLLEAGLPQTCEVRKDRAVPADMVNTARQGGPRGWWQVYLDNFITVEVQDEANNGLGKLWYDKSQRAWDTVGILCAADKNVEDATHAFELGAEIDGQFGRLSGGGLRLLKVCRASLALLCQGFSQRDLQVLCGRWAFLLQFRRPAFACLNEAWRFMYSARPSARLRKETGKELFFLVSLAPLIGCNLQRPVHGMITCSDASERGGAVCASSCLSWSGRSISHAIQVGACPKEIPVLVISLFNGIGGAFRAYDLLGLRPIGLVASLSSIGDALSGLHHYVPMTRRRLPWSWRLFRAWRRMEPPTRAGPCGKGWGRSCYC